MIVVGIDEAGRGSLIGPMIVAGVAIKNDRLKFLKNMGVKDSKQLTRNRREKLFDIICSYSEGFTIVKVSPEEIDSENLNELTYKAMIKIIYSLVEFKPIRISIDKVGNTKVVEQEIIKLGMEPNIVTNADVYFVEASAASIIAKVIRDNIIDTLKSKYGDFGSGYPSDPKTVNWVKNVYKEYLTPPPIIRRSWKILQEIAPNYYIRKW
ncbi:ribonuclease HII [Sulfurisphaera ohwakuensis]|uniref:Ribonuclease HII n=1 Tax=Sulfurisphaera ohwakuensis TaxID=69656 RepID=A0A650CEE6_SULOH|nr:ribonuclease HII [Sulfurisphaera ohwakuensis]MBB5252894.1 ribonuclease HII [Sulfurisphaera ohwakuensis]QGR16174.1 ribonuclease HII [Sulfurisphaera ohwakuensis]